MAEHAHEPSAIHHVIDPTSGSWEFFQGVEIQLPRIFGLQITKFMVLELIAAGLILWIYIPIARRVRTGGDRRMSRMNHRRQAPAYHGSDTLALV